MKEGEALAKENICISHRHRQQCREGSGWTEVGKAGVGRDISNSVNNLKKKKSNNALFHLGSEESLPDQYNFSIAHPVFFDSPHLWSLF